MQGETVILIILGSKCRRCLIDTGLRSGDEEKNKVRNIGKSLFRTDGLWQRWNGLRSLI